MNVAFLISNLCLSGAETQLARLACGLRRHGWRVGIISMLPPSAFTEELEEAEVPVVSLGMQRGKPSLGALLKTIKQLRKWRPDVLVTFNEPADILGRAGGLAARVPKIVTSIRNAGPPTPSRQHIYRATDLLTCGVVTNCQAARDMLRSHRLTRKPVVVIPNAVITGPRPQGRGRTLRRELGIPDSTFLWLAVAHALPGKDYPTLLAAIHHCADVRNDFHLLVAAGWGNIAPLKARAAELDIAARVTFLGLRNDVPDLLEACDAFVSSSAWEGMPNALLEAFAAAKPAVATAVGGVSEVLTTGHNGFLVAPKDPSALGRAMLDMMACSESERARMGAVSHEIIEEKFNPAAVVQRWVQYLSSTVGIAARTPDETDMNPLQKV